MNHESPADGSPANPAHDANIIAPPVVRHVASRDPIRPTRRGFRVFPITMIIVVGFLLWLLLFPLVTGAPDTVELVGKRMGQFIGSLTVAGLIAAFAWLVAGRSSWAANVILCVILGLHATGRVLLDWRAIQNQRNQQNLAKLRALASDLAKDVTSTIDAEAPLSTEIASFHRRISTLEDVARNSSGEESDSLMAMADALRKLEPHFIDYTNALDAFTRIGGIDPTGVSSPLIIDDRLNAARQFGAANEALITAYSSMPDNVRQGMLDKGHSPTVAGRVSSSVQRDRKYILQLDMRKTDREIALAVEQILMLFREQWGSWRFDAASNVIEFDADEHAETYDQWLQRMQIAADEQTSLAQKLITEISAMETDDP